MHFYQPSCIKEVTGAPWSLTVQFISPIFFSLQDEESKLFTRDYAEPTLEDHFDKTVLPKVMQVKNFGRSGRTKYTHLLDQDTTKEDSPWAADTNMALKFTTTKSGGMRQQFERPSLKKKK